MPLDRPSINGLYEDFSTLRFRFGARSLSEYLSDLSYGDKLMPGKAKGVHPIPLDSTLGTYEAQASMTLLERSFYDLINQLPDGYGAVKHPVTVTKGKNPAAPGGFNVDRLYGVRIVGPDGSYQRQSEDGLVIKVDLFVLYITRNGKCLCPMRLPDGGIIS